ncbi:MAG: hypothetical protein EOO09_17185 [Chitinophagaceae bacterium]|nr:MAG: hypothetical protein EOO09_17185 [Chitinophagaceae bacterium]
MNYLSVVLAGLLATVSLNAQKTETKLDENLQPATGAYRYIQYTEPSGNLYKQEIRLYPENKLFARLISKDAKGDQPEGEYLLYHPNGLSLKTRAAYSDGKLNGDYTSYFNDGKQEEKLFYKNGKLKGTGLKYYRSGLVSDSLIADGQGNIMQYQFYENGKLLREGHAIKDSVKNASWNYYSEEGQLIGTETFDNGVSKSSVCIDADGNPSKGECKNDEADFIGGIDAWRAFLTSFLQPDVPVKNNAPAGTYTVMLQFVVEKDGRVNDIRALTSFGYGMEQEAVRVLRKSPRWQPAVMFGHNVKAYRRQPITFQIVEEKKKRR